jgi:hypothetical protein
MIFVPNHPPFKPLINKLLIINQEWEGWAYIGLSSFFTLIFAVVFLIRQKRKHHIQFRNNYIFDNKLLNTMLISAHIIVLFSMGLPFKIIPGYLPDIFGFLKEFRTVGRFAWVFYFIITIYTTYILNNFIRYKYSNSRKIAPYILIILYSGLMVFEGLSYHHEVGNSIIVSPNYFAKNDDLKIDDSLNDLHLFDYQAILPLPFYHKGSENFSKPPTDKVLLYSEILSNKSALPLVSSYLARTSINESKQLMELLSPSEFDKPVINVFKNQKPILVLYSRENLSKNESDLLKRAQLITGSSQFELYRLEFDSLFKVSSCRKSKKNYIHASFDNIIAPITYKGKGAFMGKMKNWNIIYDFAPDTIKNGQVYLVSFWIYNCGYNCGQDKLNSMVFIDYENSTGEKEWLSLTNPANSETIDGCWSKVELNLKIETKKSKTSKLQLILKGNDLLDMDFIIDELNVNLKDN